MAAKPMKARQDATASASHLKGDISNKGANMWTESPNCFERDLSWETHLAAGPAAPISAHPLESWNPTCGQEK
jgi:hypothetical protein